MNSNHSPRGTRNGKNSNHSPRVFKETTNLDIKEGRERFSLSLVEVEPSSFLEVLGSQLQRVKIELTFLIINHLSPGSSFVS